MNLEQTVLQVPIEDIIPNRFQPRLNFDEQGLKELADSIKEHGIIQPLVLRKLGDKYEIIAGERRYKAAGIAGLTTVPAVIANIDDNKSAEVALVENVQRRDLTAIEEARSYKNLLDKGYLTQDQLAKRMGLSQPSIANKLRLLNLDEEVQQALLEEKISERHARTLLQIEDKNVQKEWLHRIINERLTVRQLDLELKKLQEQEEQKATQEVPLVDQGPSIDELKANASDLFAEKPRMSAEEIMAPQKFVEEEVEPLEERKEEPQVNIQIEKEIEEPVQDNAPQIVEFPHQEPTKVPDFQIATPASTNNFIPSRGLTENNNNKFFDFSNVAPEQNSKLIGVSEEPRKMEFFDSPTASQESSFVDLTSSNNQFIPNNPVEDVSFTQNKPAPIDFTQEQTDPKELSSNNKFFTPIQEQKEIELVSADKDVDPMEAVSNLTEEQTIKEEAAKDLKYAINTIRNCIQELGDNGFYISVEEIDFDTDYQITIQIDKGN